MKLTKEVIKEIEVINYYDFDKYLEKVLNNKITIPESKLNKNIFTKEVNHA